ncbi:MAG: Crp/Fnr family transcriptional regulator [Flavobacteriales bacterium]|jgi:CRP-like cAMP-binding protein
MSLIRTINELVPLSDEVRKDVERLKEREAYPKNTTIVHSGDVCRKLYFIESGLVRTYYLRDGRDVTHSFRGEREFTTVIDGFYQQKPTKYFIETIEPCVISVLSLESLNYLFDKHKEIERVGRLINFNVMSEVADHLYSLQFQTAKDRYNSLLSRYPTILKRVPLGMIASYLGITQETLSRIRSPHS